MSVSVILLTAFSMLVPPGSASPDCEEETRDMCTGYYVGPEASADGTVLVGQTTDPRPNCPTAYTYVEAESGTSGRTVRFDDGFEYTLPAETYGFSLLKMNYLGRLDYAGNAAMNSAGTSFIGCVTTHTNDAALKADPFVGTGVCENTLSYIIAASCGSAEECVDLFCGLVDAYGASDSGTYFAADQKETWLIELYTGHQYAAVKLPADKMTVFGNENILRSVNDGTGSVVSENLEKLAKDRGFDRWNSDGTLDLKMTYSVENNDYCHMRTWIGQRIFSADPVYEYNTEDEYETFYTPREKVSLKDLMDLTRNRYEGTGLDPDRDHLRVIGIETMGAAHILQVFRDLPAYMCMVRWSCIGPSEFGVFIPVSNAVRDFADEYRLMTDNKTLDTSSAYGKVKALNTLCTLERKMYKDGVTAFWSAMETYYLSINGKMLEKMKGMSETDAAGYITGITVAIEKEVCAEADRLYRECLSHYALFFKVSDQTVETMPGYFDVSDFSAKYGWKCSADGGTYTFTHEGRTVTVSPIQNSIHHRCAVTADGTSAEAYCTYEDGRICIPASFMSLFSCCEPVNVYESSEPGPGTGIVFVFAAAAAAAVCIAAVLMVRKQRSVA